MKMTSSLPGDVFWMGLVLFKSGDRNVRGNKLGDRGNKRPKKRKKKRRKDFIDYYVCMTVNRILNLSAECWHLNCHEHRPLYMEKYTSFT